MLLIEEDLNNHGVLFKLSKLNDFVFWNVLYPVVNVVNFGKSYNPKQSFKLIIEVLNKQLIKSVMTKYYQYIASMPSIKPR